MAFLAPALPFLATAATVAGPLVQGVGGFMAGQANGKALDAQSAEELRASQEQERQLRREASAAIGEQLASQWANGMEGGTGSAIDAIRQSQVNAVMDAREIRRQGISRAASLTAQAKQERRRGVFSAVEGLLGAASAASGMKNDWAQARVGTTPRPKTVGDI